MGRPETIVIVNWLPHAFSLLMAGLFLVVFLTLCTSKQSRKEKKEKICILPPPPSPAEEEKPAYKLEYCTFNINDYRKALKKKPARSYMETAIASESKKYTMETAVEKPQSVMVTALYDHNPKTNKWAMSTAAEGGGMVTAAEGGGMFTAAEGGGMVTAVERGMTTATQRGMFTAAQSPFMKTAMVGSSKSKTETGTSEDETEDDDEEVAAKKKKRKPKQRYK
ncbi:hypothetical protein M514_06763 [Trichuris suis]|uniref:Uncharacterized protein n=1 Tax=Trichuris suis TaxID=68888 RepID=A0A085M586_9BILA|nr:hypothetical protein M513_06763 [Trichuris suis]KFD69964.1 hypothetical protein M514_06763 [Trichuris suis]